MATVLDHTIIPSIDQDEAAEWYARVFQTYAAMARWLGLVGRGRIDQAESGG